MCTHVMAKISRFSMLRIKVRTMFDNGPPDIIGLRVPQGVRISSRRQEDCCLRRRSGVTAIGLERVPVDVNSLSKDEAKLL